MNLKKIVPPQAEIHSKLPKFKNKPKWLGKALKIGIPIFITLLILVVALGTPAYMISSPARELVGSLKTVNQHFQNQDLVSAEQEIENSKIKLQEIRNKYKLYSWMKVVPVIRNYYLDGQRVLIASEEGLQAGGQLIVAIEPYSDLLGFKADSEATVEGDSAEERIIFLAQTLDAISPQLDEISGHLKTASDELNQINPNRYPAAIGGRNLRSYIVTIQSSVEAASFALTDAKPLIKLLPSLLGQEEEQIYMLLFQNDAELRPTGGFMTAYAYLSVNKGKMTPLDSNDIYELDNRFGKRVEPPEIIKKYLDENVWYLRNMNLSPDFYSSMSTFMEHYRDIPGVRKIDGLIAIDTTVPVELLKVLGPVGVGGWGTFTSENDNRCDCPQVIYALEEIADRPTYAIRSDRKAVLGPLMHSIVANAMGAPKAKWPELLNVVLKSINEKHLIFYFPDSDEKQSSAEAFDAAGRIKDFEGDYLHINDSNFGGAKSNLFITENVEQEINHDPTGTTTKTLTITYDNPHPASNCNLEAGQLCLNGVYRDVVRVYVPQGSRLTSVIGSEVEEVVYEELGKTVFEVFFTLRPQSSSKLVFEYELPSTLPEPYPLLIQKQSGKPNIDHHIIYNGQPLDYTVQGDLELTLP